MSESIDMNKFWIWLSTVFTVIAISFWIIFRTPPIEEPRKIQFQNYNLDIKEIYISNVKEPIWFVKTKNPTVALLVLFKNEGKRSFKDQPGIFSLVFSLLLQGAGPYDSTELRKILDRNSISLSLQGGSDSSKVTLYVVPEKFQLGMDILQEVMINAHFPEKEILNSKQDINTGLRQSLISPDVIANEEMVRLMYPPEHPYCITRNDVLKNIDKYTRADLIEAYNKLFVSQNAQIMVAGNISEEELKAACEKLFSALAKHKANSFEDVKQETNLYKEGTTIHLMHDSPQTGILFTHPGVESNSKEKYAFDIANMVLGIGPRSKLYTELREKQGFVYSINFDVSEYAMSSYINCWTQTDPENRDILIAKIREIFKEFADKGMTQEELDSRKIAIAASDDLSSAPNITLFLYNCRSQNVPLGEVNNFMNNYYNLELAEINSVIKKIFDFRKLIFVSIGKEEKYD